MILSSRFASLFFHIFFKLDRCEDHLAVKHVMQSGQAGGSRLPPVSGLTSMPSWKLKGSS